MNMKNFIRFSAAVIALFTPTLAFAHHPLGGMPMITFADGLLSGAGHSLLGFDHLFFVALVGFAAIYTKQRFISPMAYIVAMLFGCYAMSTGIGLPVKEVIIGLYLLTLGAVVLSGKALGFFLLSQFLQVSGCSMVPLLVMLWRHKKQESVVRS
jgi:urease accessory protein